MIKTTTALSVFILFFCIRLSAQYYNQLPQFLRVNGIWVFGSGTGVSFSTGRPVSMNTAFSGLEGCAAVSSPVTGDLLFYSNSRMCWDRNHTPMPGSNGLKGNISTTQGVCAVPVADTPGRYYLFTLGPEGDSLHYSMVDMSLNGGLGDIVPGRKNILLDIGLLSESMIAVPGENCDVWLLVHAFDRSELRAYRITRSGLDPNPVVSATGYLPGRWGNRQGSMKVSPDRMMLAVSCSKSLVSGANGIILYRFNPGTGQASAPMKIERQSVYDICFSPDNSKLYGCGYESFVASVYQYNVSVYDSATITNSRTYIRSARNEGTSFRLYRDSIYVTSSGLGFLDRINRPNLPGNACNYQLSAVALTTYTSYNLPNDVVYPYPPDTLFVKTLDTMICEAMPPVTLTALPGFSAYEWENGDTGRIRTITERGVYYVISKDDCRPRIDSFVIGGADITFSLGNDTLICAAPYPVTFSVPLPGAAYTWQDGSVDSFYTATDEGEYWVVAELAGCRSADTIRLRFTDLSQDIGPDTAFCDRGAAWELHAHVPPRSVVLWQDGSTAGTLAVTTSGRYWVTVSEEYCASSDTADIRFISLQQDLGQDTIICMETQIQLNLEANVPPGAMVLWDNSTDDPVRRVSDSGAYWVVVSDYGCTGADTIRVSLEFCDCVFTAPSAFSPNGDGRNDTFRPVIQPGCPVSGYQLQVYNRWGHLVYQTPPGAAHSDGWDGMYRGLPAEVGTYMYVLEFEAGTRGQRHRHKGDVTLIR